MASDTELKLVISAKNTASSVFKKMRDDVNDSSTQMGSSLERLKLASERMSGAFKVAAVASGVAIAGAAFKAGQAAFEQVRSVENASFALRAYEKDAGKVKDVLAELVKFARSDMGVLFQREDLFKAASNLKGFGDETSKLNEHVQILARGVSLGMTTFDELSQIIGRASQSGTLAAEEFDMLASRGIILDRRFRGAKVSSKELYDELSRVLPADLLKDRANTIDGSFIRLQSAFRDLGSSILGVDRDTNKFIKGGLGDQLMQNIGRLRDIMASPEFKQGVTDFATSLASVGSVIVGTVLPAVMSFLNFLASNTWIILAVAAAFTAIKTAMFLSGAIQAFTDVMVVARAVGIGSATSISAAWTGLRALVASPLAMPAIVVAAALVSLGLVIDAVNKIRGAITDVNNAAKAAESLAPEAQMRDLQQKATAARARGDTAAVNRYANALAALGGGRATGGPVSAGQTYMVGEKQPELFRPYTQGRIEPTTSQGAGQTVVNIHGDVINQTPEAANAWWDRLDRTQRLARAGMS